ncbi:endonuclease VII domain-containing protein [Streptodolium elevatio]|uniref:Endonuclease VII domain-containing protein n=1 Tax=Streptodolium elevatio TaxID=3157996 RepID=A0ABV3DTA4_9ACTN
MSDLPSSKKCSRCKRHLPRNSFASNKSIEDGLQSYCRECAANYYAERRRAKGFTVRPKVEVPPGHKRCPGCGVVKPHSEWHIHRRSSDGFAARCKACRAVEGRAGHLKRQYGITEQRYQEMVRQQVGRCAICLVAKAEHVDHDHETGKVRAVLCFNCNAALGHFKDRPDALRRAAAYLEGIVWKPTRVAPGVYRLPS